MFTGIIEEIGRTVDLQRGEDLQRTTLEAPKITKDMKIGDSVSIDGVCQTVVDLRGIRFGFESVQETLCRTTLGDLERGHRVNLERSMQLGGRLGGHLVMGHVDSIGTIVRRIDRREGALFTLSLEDELTHYVAPRGSIAVDGISLTVVSVLDDCFEVSVIPHTLAHTTLSVKGTGDRVNIEVDILARYVHRRTEHGSGKSEDAERGITAEWLRTMGF